jgi:hypothetical protein
MLSKRINTIYRPVTLQNLCVHCNKVVLLKEFTRYLNLTTGNTEYKITGM